MKIDTHTPSVYKPNFNGNWLAKFDNALGKLIAPKVIVTPENQTNIIKVTELAHKHYNKLTPEPVSLKVKNGNKEFEFLYNNSAWNKVRLTKKGEEIQEFEIMYIKNDKDFAFYSTGTYACKIIQEKYIKKFNETLADWLPRLIKKHSK